VDGSARCFKTTASARTAFVDPLNLDGGRYQALALSDYHVCVLRQNGRLACWGSEALAVSGPTASSESFVALATGNSGTCALSSSGRIICLGEQRVDFGPTFAQDFTQLVVTHLGLYGLRSDGSVYAYGIEGVPISSGFEWLPQRFTQLVGTSDGVCALSSTGEVVCRGQFYLNGSALVTASR
jgi:hypothetical protein